MKFSFKVISMLLANQVKQAKVVMDLVKVIESFDKSISEVWKFLSDNIFPIILDI